MLAGLALGILAGVTGCQSPYPTGPGPTAANVPATERPPDALTLREGDVLKIAFPGAQNLDTTQTIRRDGIITLSLIGELKVAGMTSADLEKELVRLYASQLVSKEITVTVISSSFAVFVTGAVIRPGKVLADHPITALEAIMEAGGFDYAKANLKEVVVIRQEEGKTRNFSLNLKLALEGKQNEPFYLKPSDIIYVPEKFSWF